jgi:hypothetical protein
MKWQSIFEQSRIYGGVYNGDELPQFHIPVKNSWFQRRLNWVRQQQRTELLDQSKKDSTFQKPPKDV